MFKLHVENSSNCELAGLNKPVNFKNCYNLLFGGYLTFGPSYAISAARSSCDGCDNLLFRLPVHWRGDRISLLSLIASRVQCHSTRFCLLLTNKYQDFLPLTSIECFSNSSKYFESVDFWHFQSKHVLLMYLISASNTIRAPLWPALD